MDGNGYPASLRRQHKDLRWMLWIVFFSIILHLINLLFDIPYFHYALLITGIITITLLFAFMLRSGTRDKFQKVIIWSFPVILVGGLLNFMALTANGFAMPVYDPEESIDWELVTSQRHFLVTSPEEANLFFLVDRFDVGFGIMSVGDLVVVPNLVRTGFPCATRRTENNTISQVCWDLLFAFFFSYQNVIFCFVVVGMLCLLR